MGKSAQPLNDDHCQFFLYQTLRGVKYVHSAGVIHRDIKPRNLLVNVNCDLKICDFGLARVEFSDEEFKAVCPMSEYVCTRWFRAPEILFSTEYTKAIDVWAIGCTFAEMLTRRPLFPGRNTQHQLQLIVDLMGTPQRNSCRLFQNDRCRKFVDTLHNTPGKPFEKVFQHATTSQQSFLKQVLAFDPDKRVSVPEALQHDYLNGLYCPSDEPTREPLDTTEFEFERRKVTARALREELYREVIRYSPEARTKYVEEQERKKASGTNYKITDFGFLSPADGHAMPPPHDSVENAFLRSVTPACNYQRTVSGGSGVTS